jgi:hypothetical protein
MLFLSLTQVTHQQWYRYQLAKILLPAMPYFFDISESIFPQISSQLHLGGPKNTGLTKKIFIAESGFTASGLKIIGSGIIR